MTNASDAGALLPWTTRGAKERTAVRRIVKQLLEELAPERLLMRTDRGSDIRRHRMPNGCVLQSTTSALTVSWFEDDRDSTAKGELHIVVWNGVVTRPGTPRRVGATIVHELILLPVEDAGEVVGWRTAAGSDYATDVLGARCVALLEEQISRNPTAPT